MIRTLATLAAALILTACGTSSIGDDNTPADGPTAAALAAKLDCTGDDGTDTNEVSCEFGDSFLGITTYPDQQARDTDVQAVQVAGVRVLVGPTWMIDAPDEGTLAEAQEVVGGDVK